MLLSPKFHDARCAGLRAQRGAARARGRGQSYQVAPLSHIGCSVTVANGGDVMVYRSTKPVKRENMAEAQRLEASLKEFEPKGFLGSYKSTRHLADQVHCHLTDMLLKKRSNPEPEPKALRPDVRVLVGTAMTPDTVGLNVSLENHSKETVYGSKVTFVLKEMFQPGIPMVAHLKDVFGEYMHNFALQPGQSKTWFVPLDALFLSPQFAPEKLERVVLHDQIGRRYEGDAAKLEECIAALRHHVDPERNRQAVLARLFNQLKKPSS